MNLISPKQLTEKAVKACVEAVENGWKIVLGWFGSLNEHCCCPLTAIGLTQTKDLWREGGTGIKVPALWTVLERVGIGSDEAHNFYEGYDAAAGKRIVESGGNRWYLAGIETHRLLKEKGLV